MNVFGVCTGGSMVALGHIRIVLSAEVAIGCVARQI